MQILRTVADMRRLSREWQSAGERVCFVPTMGNLHAGHLRLVERAQELGSRTVVSIFVNPLQFGPNEDLAAYPRTEDEDCRRLREFGADAVFMPEVSEIYPRPLAQMCRIEVPGLSEDLCGRFRPGHFAGVATVVGKLFNIVAPRVAVFGEKDFQQLLVIRRMVTDLALPVEVEGVATLREPDGVAMSSRNAYLDAEQRRRAPRLYASLRAVHAGLTAGRQDYEVLESEARQALEAGGLEPEYVAVRRAEDLQVPADSDVDLVVLAAARLGRARLIDNLRWAGGN